VAARADGRGNVWLAPSGCRSDARTLATLVVLPNGLRPMPMLMGPRKMRGTNTWAADPHVALREKYLCRTWLMPGSPFFGGRGCTLETQLSTSRVTPPPRGPDHASRRLASFLKHNRWHHRARRPTLRGHIEASGPRSAGGGTSARTAAVCSRAPSQLDRT